MAWINLFLRYVPFWDFTQHGLVVFLPTFRDTVPSSRVRTLEDVAAKRRQETKILRCVKSQKCADLIYTAAETEHATLPVFKAIKISPVHSTKQHRSKRIEQFMN